jgi:hypothetical protein
MNPYKNQALRDWNGEYPEIFDEKKIGGFTQHLLQRATFQGDRGKHWFCGCDEFHNAVISQPNGTLSSIANAKPLRCKHIDEIGE